MKRNSKKKKTIYDEMIDKIIETNRIIQEANEINERTDQSILRWNFSYALEAAITERYSWFGYNTVLLIKWDGEIQQTQVSDLERLGLYTYFPS